MYPLCRDRRIRRLVPLAFLVFSRKPCTGGIVRRTGRKKSPSYEIDRIPKMDNNKNQPPDVGQRLCRGHLYEKKLYTHQDTGTANHKLFVRERS